MCWNPASSECSYLQIINNDIKTKIQHDIMDNVLQGKYASTVKSMPLILEALHGRIPENKRVSFGRVYTVQVLSRYLFSSLMERDANVYKIGATLFERSEDSGSKGVALGILSFCGIADYGRVLPFFEASASSDDWNAREFAQMFFRKLIHERPDETKEYLSKLTESKDPHIRRFVSETLRPVRENKWFYKNPAYPLSILRSLFRESSEYPRTSVGNNLSDLARHLPGLVSDLVRELVASGDRNSYWIAYRACRNLVKKEPVRAMTLLRVDEYRYKKRVYRRSEYQRD
jgi:3-methyladenine DNA glycosylase AlkC